MRSAARLAPSWGPGRFNGAGKTVNPGRGIAEAMRWKALALGLLLVTSGCFGQAGVEGDDEGGPAQAPPSGSSQGTQVVERELVFEANVSGPQVGGGRLDVQWPAELGVGLVGLELSLSWTQGTNAFGIETERPDGTVHKLGPPSETGSTSVEGEVTELVPGEYVFYLTAGDGIVIEDRVELVASATFELAEGTQPAVEEGTVRGPVRVEPANGGYRATVSYRANGTAQDRMQVTVNTTNGGISHRGNLDQAMGAVVAWAHGDTREEARRRLLEIDVDLTVREGAIRAIAEAPNWEKRGASAEVGVPSETTIQGTFDTTNGPIQLRNANVDGILADTTNGGIEGDVAGRGEMTFDTTNGAITVEVYPTASAQVTADTTNGAIELGLAEGEAVGYRIDADTTNGEITESMDEASLSGSDDEATLETDGYADRTVQVTGLADTTNGNIHFASR